MDDYEKNDSLKFYRIGRRAPLAVLILISGLSSVSLAITLLGTGLMEREILFCN